ncbi:unnamed protein product [Leuciscus chuanchicus]
MQFYSVLIGVAIVCLGLLILIRAFCVVIKSSHVTVPGHFLLHSRTGTRYTHQQAIAVQRRLDRIRRATAVNHVTVQVPPTSVASPQSQPATPPPWQMEPPPSYETLATAGTLRFFYGREQAISLWAHCSWDGVCGIGYVHDFRRGTTGVRHILCYGSDNGGHGDGLVTVILAEKEELCGAEKLDLSAESSDGKSPQKPIRAPLAGFCDDEKVEISADPKLHTENKHSERVIVLHTCRSSPSVLACSSNPLTDRRTTGTDPNREMFYGKMEDSCYFTSELESE